MILGIEGAIALTVLRRMPSSPHLISPNSYGQSIVEFKCLNGGSTAARAP
jgi:hypothetical protein